MPVVPTASRRLLPGAALLAALQFGVAPLAAQNVIPQTSGFNGFGAFNVAIFEGKTSFLASGPPLLGAISRKVITTFDGSPLPLKAPALLVGGEVNYTFASSRTQLFLGGALEDILLLDVAIEIGARQQLPDKSVLAVSGIVTPFQQRPWVDPYVLGVPREFDKVNYPGFRIRWSRILGSGLELAFTDRFYRFDAERSGEWLVDQGQLAPGDVPLLDRNGDDWRIQGSYGFRAGRHRIEPILMWMRENRNGAAMANDGLFARLNYRFLDPRVRLEANIGHSRRIHDAVHPVFGERVDRRRTGAQVGVAIPVELLGSRKWSIVSTTEYVVEHANVDFFNSRLFAFTLGLGWRGTRQ